MHGWPSNPGDDKNIDERKSILVCGIYHAIATRWNDKLLKAEATRLTSLAIDNGHIWREIQLCKIRFEKDRIISFA